MNIEFESLQGRQFWGSEAILLSPICPFPRFPKYLGTMGQSTAKGAFSIVIRTSIR